MENNYEKKNVFKIIAIILASLLILAGVVGVIAVLTKDKDVEERPNYIQEGIVMNAKPTLRLNDPSGVRFTAVISPELAYEVQADENKEFGMVLAPISYFMKVDLGESYTETDWLNAFAEENLTVLTLTGLPRQVATEDGTTLEYQFNGGITNILYGNTNLQFLGIAYVQTTDGENVSYKYASFPEGLSYKQCSYSYAYLAAETLNSYVVGSTHLAQSDLDLCNSVINKSVDLANGLSEDEMTDDGSTYAVTLSETAKTLKVGETLSLEVDIAEGVKVPVWWMSDNSSVATVKDGVITAVSNGTVNIHALVAGEKYTCVVTVGETTTEAAE